MSIDPEFYFFTINAADSNGIYNMEDTKVAFWGLEGVGPARVVPPVVPPEPVVPTVVSENIVVKAALNNKIKKLKKKAEKAKGSGKSKRKSLRRKPRSSLSSCGPCSEAFLNACIVDGLKFPATNEMALPDSGFR